MGMNKCNNQHVVQVWLCIIAASACYRELASGVELSNDPLKEAGKAADNEVWIAGWSGGNCYGNAR